MLNLTRHRLAVAILLLVAPGLLAQEPSPLLASLSDAQTLELPTFDPAVAAPQEILGYPLGHRFTRYGEMLRYLETMAGSSPRVEITSYGRTYEDRPLVLLTITSAQNHARLEELRSTQLALADPGALSPDQIEGLLAKQPVVVWLGYGIHGNESSSSEAALATAYTLAAAQGELAELLEQVVVLIDPLSNPDGRVRYLQWYAEQRGRAPDAATSAVEHHERWPGGRFNHYLIDLNRDWPWLTQQETRQRLVAYRRWEPQVHVDLHEMYSDSTYFFPPTAAPIHPSIDPLVIDWLEVFGEGNAAAFDRQGWLYYKGEVFDLFYPGYGDSYPALRGAVGMTYEMAGGGAAGEIVRLPEGSLLTLADRVARHLVSSLATVRTAARHRQDLLAHFVASRRNTPGTPRTYLWPAGQQEASSLAALLTSHGVTVQQLSTETTLQVARPNSTDSERRTFAAGTFAASTEQPLARLVRALMDSDFSMSPEFLERQRERVEQNLQPEFYDITAWSLPLAYNVETWLLQGVPTHLQPLAAQPGRVQGRGGVGYLVPPQGLAGLRLAATLQELGIKHRVALADFVLDDATYRRGTLFVPRRHNPPDLEGVMQRLSSTMGVEVHGADSSTTQRGISLGSEQMRRVEPVRVGLLSAPGLAPTSLGFLWHLLDRQLELPHSRLPLAAVGARELAEFDVLILPDTYPQAAPPPEEAAARLKNWVRAGGFLVAVGDSLTWLGDPVLVELERWQPPGEEEGTAHAESLERRPLYTPGAALATELSPDHPLSVGLDSPPAVLFRGTSAYLPTGDPRQDVLVAAPADPVVAGFAWPEARRRLAGALLVGAFPVDEGYVVFFAQEPVFRLFWRATMPLLANAVLFGPSFVQAEW